MAYRGLDDRLSTTWWYPVVMGVGLLLCLAVTGQNLAEARWGRALFGVFPIAFFAAAVARAVRARRARRR